MAPRYCIIVRSEVRLICCVQFSQTIFHSLHALIPQMNEIQIIHIHAYIHQYQIQVMQNRQNMDSNSSWVDTFRNTGVYLVIFSVFSMVNTGL